MGWGVVGVCGVGWGVGWKEGDMIGSVVGWYGVEGGDIITLDQLLFAQTNSSDLGKKFGGY